LDDSLGAMMRFLMENQLYDDTMIVFMNDHGMGAKGTLYEQGSRIMQIIRYPELFPAGKVLPDDFVVSSVDLAKIIFDLAKTKVKYGKNDYVIDSNNWVQDALDYFDHGRTDFSNTDDTLYDDVLGRYRFMDVFNSHAIVTADYKYIFRQTKVVETLTGAPNMYPQILDSEQIYDLRSDPLEQDNRIKDPKLDTEIGIFRDIMMKYIIDRGCPLFICKVPPTAKDDDASMLVRGLDINHESNDNVIWYNVIIICILCLILLIIFISNYTVNQHYDKRKKISECTENSPLLI